MLIDRVIEMMMGEDFETVTKFLGYEPDMEVFSNNQLLEMEIESAAKQMTDECLINLYEELYDHARKRAEMKHNIQLVEDLLSTMEEYKRKINSSLMSNIVDLIDTVITDIEALKCDMK